MHIFVIREERFNAVLMIALLAYTYPRKSDDDSESLDMTEKNSVSSNENAQLSSETISSGSLSDSSPEFEQSPLPDTIAAEPMEDLSLPSKYKSAIKGFVSHLKQKLNASKNRLVKYPFLYMCEEERELSSIEVFI